MTLTWFAGVDRGSQTHQVCVLDAAGTVRGERAFEHGGAGLSDMADWLLSFAAGAADEVGVAIETPRGPVVESLMERGCPVHAINPKQLDRFRDRISPAGAKDDRRDARVLASALRTDPHCLRQLEPTDPAIVELPEWSRLSEDLTRKRVRLANRMRAQLWRYYPQLLDAVDDDVAAAQRVREATLTKLLTQHRIRRVDAAMLRGRLRTPAIKVRTGRRRGRHCACAACRRAPRPDQPATRSRAPPARPIGAATHRGRAGRRLDRVRGGRASVVEHTG